MTDIRHAHLYGTRESKYEWLNAHDVLSTDWNEISPQSPFYLLIPQNTDLLSEYQEGWKITEVMPEFSIGCLTKRDNLVIGRTLDELHNQMQSFLNPAKSDEEAVGEFNLKLADQDMWIAHTARLSIQISDIDKYIWQEAFRPFDSRFIFYHPKFVARLNRRVMQHLDHQNLAFVTVRQLAALPFNHIWVTDSLSDQHIISVRTKEGGVISPLYLYPDTNNPQKLALIEQRRSNFSQDFLDTITAKLGYTPIPEAIFYYIYAIFHSPTYRTRYAEFLKIDFPRVPLTSNDELFRKLGGYGEELVALHLMKSPKLENFITQFIESGGNCVVDAGHPKYSSGDVVINKKGDRFASVPENVWNFYVGGYQVCHKWLKDRKGRTLSPEDIQHYQKIVVALHETIALITKIDAAIPIFPIE
jgi:predicted helicase